MLEDEIVTSFSGTSASALAGSVAPRSDLTCPVHQNTDHSTRVLKPHIGTKHLFQIIKVSACEDQAVSRQLN